MPRLLRLCGFAVVIALAAGCSPPGAHADDPGLAPRDTTMTTVKPSRQDLANRVSLSGKVTIGPVFGLVAPVGGQVRYLDVKPVQGTPTKPTRVANIVAGGRSTPVDVPAGAVFAGRLFDDRTTVPAGMPIVSAKYSGYGIVADIDGSQGYKIYDAFGAVQAQTPVQAQVSVQAQIKNGPGPFACTVLGTIAALPAGTIPDPAPRPSASGQPDPARPAGPAGPVAKGQGDSGAGAQTPSDPTGMRLVCTAPADVKLINGAGATLEVVTERATNVLVLPVEAVAGMQGKGKVDIVKPGGARETRDVVLGLTDGKVVQIKSGLTGDETIAVPGPNLPPAKPNDNNPDTGIPGFTGGPK